MKKPNDTTQDQKAPQQASDDGVAVLYLHPGEHEWLCGLVDEAFGKPITDEIIADPDGKYAEYTFYILPDEDEEMQRLFIMDDWGDDVGKPTLFQRDTLWDANEEDSYSLQKTLRKEAKL